MKNKLSIAIIIILTALFVLFMAYIDANPRVEGQSGETLTFNVSTGANPVNECVKSIKTMPYYEGYDRATLEWMETLDGNMAFYGNDSIVIMSNADAGRIPAEPGITDVYIYNIFKAKVIESRSLGKDYPMVYHVENVDFISQEIVSNGLA